MHNETEYDYGYMDGIEAGRRRGFSAPSLYVRQPVGRGPFEDFASRRGLDISTDETGRYTAKSTRAAWDIWQEVVDAAALRAYVACEIKQTPEQAEEYVRGLSTPDEYDL